MALSPRFRPGATKRPFVDREPVIQAFDTVVSRTDPLQYVLNVVGVGGIGKSRLLDHFSDRIKETHPRAKLDLQAPSQRQQQNALVSLRLAYGAQAIDFHRFDIAYAVMWQRLHPHLELGRDGHVLVEGSEILSDLVDSVTGVPIVGSATKLLDLAQRRLRRWHRVSKDSTLQELDSLGLPELADAVTYLFAQDLAVNSKTSPILLVDSYEALVGGQQVGARAATLDAWLRDLIAQLDFATVVIASRKPLHWQQYSVEWSPLIQTIKVDGLPTWACHEVLSTSGLSDEELISSIAAGSEGLPFYLHLATESGRAEGSVSTREAILERFLLHVDQQHIRALRLLSASRFFDLEVFQALGESFYFASDQFAWESVSGYSFVESFDDNFRLHQLMAVSLRGRLSDDELLDVHHMLAEHWAERGIRVELDSLERIQALTEAVYHGTLSGWPPLRVLEAADRVRDLAAGSGVDVVRTDLSHLAGSKPLEQQTSRYELVLRLLDAEVALLEGATTRAVELSARTDDRPGDVVEARLALVAAHTRRILGDTVDSLARYETLWSHHGTQETAPSVHQQAGLWAADLRMAMGKFAAAVAAAETLMDSLSGDEHQLRGDLHRLVHLAHRFEFDLERAQDALALAFREYSQAGTIIEIANAMTNRVELQAMTAPELAIELFSDALEAQEAIQAKPELGKLWCAKGLAHLQMNELEEAESALDTGIEYLELAGYRSGRARAELYRAALFARRGLNQDATAASDRAIADFELTSVYPTFIIAAVILCELIGSPSPTRAEARRRAIESLDVHEEEILEERITTFVRSLLDNGYEAAVSEARATRTPLSGYYNRNVRVGDYLVREREVGAASMDLEIWSEADVLAAVGQTLTEVPHLVSFDRRARIQIHEFIEGRILNERFPRGVPIEGALVQQMLDFLLSLRLVPRHDLPVLPADWPADGNCSGFASRLSAVTRQVHNRYRDEFGWLWKGLGFPDDFLEVVDWSTLSDRDFTLVHADVHRKNIIIRPDGRLAFIDWEFALWGDPVYDLAVHLHKMGYTDDEELLVVNRWTELQMDPANERQLADLATYRKHERIKSAVVDSVRYRTRIVSGVPDRTAFEMTARLTEKIQWARSAWQMDDGIEPERVERVLTSG